VGGEPQSQQEGQVQQAQRACHIILGLKTEYLPDKDDRGERLPLAAFLDFP